MDDEKIIELYWQRDEGAISQSECKYGGLCRRVAANILASRQDCEEYVSDTWLGAWNAIPPARPARLGAFFAKITRNLALKKAEYLTAAKRNRLMEESLEELADCVSGVPSAGRPVVTFSAAAILLAVDICMRMVLLNMMGRLNWRTAQNWSTSSSEA